MRREIWQATALLAAACQSTYDKTGERRLPAPPGVELAVVQVHVDIPLHYVGLHHTVVCRSPSTASAPGNPKDGISPGWMLVGHLANLDGGDRSASGRERAMRKAEDLARGAIASGDGWLAWKDFLLRLSYDGCRTWRDFLPWELVPADEVDTSAVKSPCEPKQCARVVFDTFHRPEYTDLQVSGNRIAFTMKSAALKGSGERRVASDDGGRSWRVTPRASP